MFTTVGQSADFFAVLFDQLLLETVSSPSSGRETELRKPDLCEDDLLVPVADAGSIRWRPNTLSGLPRPEVGRRNLFLDNELRRCAGRKVRGK